MSTHPKALANEGITPERNKELKSNCHQYPEYRTEPPPIVKMPDDIPSYIPYLVTAPLGKEPRGDLGGGVYEASAEVVKMLFYMNYGWW